ncbi:MAG: dTDP-4-dehydrorhamnose 3,5-epimerase [Candidatus Omnitrophota bacterium]
MKFLKTTLPDVLVIEPEVFSDQRGSFFESFNRELFRKNGISAEFVQDNHSVSARGVLRGLHYQVPPRAQAKLVRVVRGEAFDVVVDIRQNSNTFGRHACEILSAENRKMLYIPPGFAHGFLSLKEGTEFLYKVSDVYSPGHERGILWSDPALKLPWPKMEAGIVLSEKDKKYPPLAQAEKAF